jgi:hypothetical protein
MILDQDETVRRDRGVRGYHLPTIEKPREGGLAGCGKLRSREGGEGLVKL